ncbi:MAG TPA: ATP-binding cassette domain-containing protein, partial [Gemmatimonadales bacterium]|nr:ATP-binding cassette domain-containing protein [Gemmatimonadales bacterium]
MPSPIVSMRDITRRCGAVVANQHVSLDLYPGEVHAIVGENGAGKTTLMKVLYGQRPPHAGGIEFEGRAVRIPSPAEAMKLGIGMVHQHFLLVDTLSVADNVVLGREPHGALGSYDPVAAQRRVAAIAERYRLAVDPAARVSGLSVGEQQRVEILKVLYRGARVLILDEPTAVLTPQEAAELAGILRSLTAQGTSVIFITHKLNEVLEIADRITVLRRGRVVGSALPDEATQESLAEMMVGRPVDL